MPTEAQIAGGHKANINNPNTSQEAKEHSQQVLDNEFNGGDGMLSRHAKIFCSTNITCDVVPHADDNKQKNPGNVIGGLKATTKNPNVSEEAKKSAEERLQQMQ